tara:strand:+ start:201 stop:419 length:219 start_codon:yes stop_codon:yes gene_type:complete
LANNNLYTWHNPSKDHIKKRNDYGGNNRCQTAVNFEILDEFVGHIEQKRIDDNKKNPSLTKTKGSDTKTKNQ